MSNSATIWGNNREDFAFEDTLTFSAAFNEAGHRRRSLMFGDHRGRGAEIPFDYFHGENNTLFLGKKSISIPCEWVFSLNL